MLRPPRPPAPLRRARVLVWATLALGWVLSLAPAARAQSTPAPDATAFTPVESVPTLSIPGGALPASLLDREITRVVVRGRGAPARFAVRTVQPGEPLTGEVARRALRELADSGAFSTIEAFAEPDGEGVALVLVATARQLVARIDLEGGVLDRSGTLKAVGLSVGGEISAASPATLSAGIERHYAEHGFPRAKASVRVVGLDDPLEALVAIDVEPGAPRLVSQRVFVITPELDREVGDEKSSYAVRTGDRLDRGALTEADRTLANRLQETGFWQATVRHAVREVGPHTYLYVYVESGPRHVPVFRGNLAFDADQLEQAAKTGASPARSVDELRDRIERHYVTRGFLDVEVEVEEQDAPDGARRFLVMNLRENARVRVARRTWLCLDEAAEDAEDDADDVGAELDAILEEALPHDDTLSAPDPTTAEATLGGAGGERAAPLVLDPSAVYAPEAYQKALSELRELYLSRGFLNAQIGPIGVVRARCAPDSPPGSCRRLPSGAPRAVCGLDDAGLPLPEPTVPVSATCVPDRARGISCAPDIELRITMHLGPRTSVYDLRFEGQKTMSERELASIAGVQLEKAVSLAAVEEAKARLVEAYQDRGYAYVEVRTAIEPSPDRTRARVRFSIQERDRVFIDEVEIEGAERTDEELVRSRLALRRGDPYSRRGVRLSEERIATLGTFASVSVSLVDPEVPQRRKRLLVRLSEYPSQYIDPKVGFSTGEGVRFGFEYGHRNIGGRAIALTLRLQLSYLFDFMILDSGVAENLGPLPASQRLERRNSLRVAFPQIGLGPLLSFYVEGVDLRDNQRDFGLTREAVVPSITYRPMRELVGTLSASIELNDVQIFNAASVDDAIRNNRSLERLLRFPDGTTFAVAQRLGMSWDRRDNPFAATSGTYVSADVEHVNAFPADPDDPETDPLVSHFLKLGARFSGYVRLTKSGVAVALSVAGGTNVQLASESRTYPDRAFFLGGFDTLRSFLADSVVPQDVAEQLLEPDPDTPEGERLTIDDVAVRGGDLSVNPRAELRVPLGDTFGFGLFVDAGNLWVDPAAFDPTIMRWGAGAGVRIATPIGPLAFDYGLNLDRRPWEDVGALHFSIGLF